LPRAVAFYRRFNVGASVADSKNWHLLLVSLALLKFSSCNSHVIE